MFGSGDKYLKNETYKNEFMEARLSEFLEMPRKCESQKRNLSSYEPEVIITLRGVLRWWQGT